MDRRALTEDRPSADGCEEAFFTGARHAHPLLDSIADGAVPARALIIGSAGSGKSTVLGRLHRLLGEAGRTVTRLGDTVSIDEVHPEDVLFVDDLHLLGDDRIREVQSRVLDPDAAAIIAVRPWPRTEPLRMAVRDVERSVPTVVAGHVIAADVATYLRARGHTGWERCLPHLLELTGGVTWLVSEALTLHGPGPCGEPRHEGLQHLLAERVAQRLDGVGDALRDGIERAAITGPAAAADTGPHFPSDPDDLILQGYSAGLLLRNGIVPPVVRDAVRAAIPVHRLVDAAAPSSAAAGAAGPGGGQDRSPTHTGGHRFADLLCAQAASLLDSDPSRAEGLYLRAIEAGLEPTAVVMARIQAAWARGDLDAAARLLDTAVSARPEAAPGLADAAAAVWAARTMMSIGSDAHHAADTRPEDVGARAAIVHLGAGRPDRVAGTAPTAPRGERQATARPHTTVQVALNLLEAGLQATLTRGHEAEGVGDLVRASELYTASGISLPIAELPAVIAAAAAIGLGDLASARFAIESALTGRQGGVGARRRLLLWCAWVALDDERPADARDALRQARGQAQSATPRDRLIEAAVEMVLTRRYEDVASLEAVWSRQRDQVRHAHFDLYLLQPLSTLVAATARIGDPTTMAPHLAQAQDLLARLGSPPLWSAHVQWSGIQQGILLNRPQLLAPYAHALVDASDHSPVARAMSQAGRVWMAVLAGHVDADAVEAAASTLAGVGLAWDGARLAGHGSARTDDRKDASRLLACARRLHPRDAVRPATDPPIAAAEDQAAPAVAPLPTAPATTLSARELDVAVLVLQGKTYAEIGKEIFISPRTAEHHIARIRQRLGASNRSDLLAKLRVLMGSASPAPQPTHHGTRARTQSPIRPPRDRGFPPIPEPDRPRSVAGEHTDSVTGVLE